MKYKYIHIFNFSSIGFDDSVVKILNDKEGGFLPEEHLFISRSPEEYDVIKKYGNVVLDTEDVQLINKYADSTDWIIVHGIQGVSSLCKVKKRYLGKVVWRTWGSDAGYEMKDGEIIKNIIKKVLNLYYGRYVHKLAAVGVANVVDSINLSKMYGDVIMFTMPYCTNEYEILEKIRRRGKASGSGNINIMVGHSGFQNDNHLEVIRSLKRFVDQNIKAYFILSYGDFEYIDKVKQYANKYMREKAVFVEKKMSYEQYADLVSSMDIAVLDGTGSYALGNLQMLLYFGIQLYVNGSGVIRQGLDAEGIPYRTTEEMRYIGYDELKQTTVYQMDKKLSMTMHDYHSVCESWHALLDYLESRRVS